MSATLLLALLAAPVVAALPQDPPAAEEQESEVDKLLRHARTGRAHVRPQAANRLQRLWASGDEATRAEVITRLRAEAGGDRASLAALGSALVEVLAQFEDDALRARLWAAVDDPEFPWRPFAARGLALTARSEELARLRTLTGDPIGPVRAASLMGLQTLDARGDQAAVRRLLADDVDYVRRSAADLLLRWGHDDALWYLLEELTRDDRFFDRPTGREARYKAYLLALTHLGDLGSYDPQRGPEENKIVLAVLGTKVAARAGERPDLPAAAVASPAHEPALIGLELRSCRRGEFFLRWTADDVLLVGTGNPAVGALPEGTAARLREVAAARTLEVTARSVGEPGCDLELLYWRPEEATQMWIVSKGPQVVEDLRPAPLSALHAALVETLPEGDHDDPRVAGLRARILDALAAVGGALD